MKPTRALAKALQVPLEIRFKHREFRGPAWAVLIAFAMFLTATVAVAAAVSGVTRSG
jgi:hypothetical protein